MLERAVPGINFYRSQEGGIKRSSSFQISRMILTFLLLAVASAQAEQQRMHALALDGTNYLSTGKDYENNTSNRAMLKALDKTFSVECWVRLDGVPIDSSELPTRRAFVSSLTDQGSVEGGANIHNSRGWWLGLDKAGRLSFGASTKEKEKEIVVHSPNRLNVGAWHYIVATYDAVTGRGKLFLNGRPAGGRVMGKGGVSYESHRKSQAAAAATATAHLSPPIEVARYQNRNVDHRLRMSIIDLALWRSVIKAPAVSRAAADKVKRDEGLIAEATLAIPSKSLVALFRFDEGHGNIIQSFGYTSFFLDGKNPTLVSEGPRSPVWIEDDAAPPLPPIPAPLPKSTIRGEEVASKMQTAAKLADLVTEGRAADLSVQASLTKARIITKKAKKTEAEAELDEARLDALHTGDQLDTARVHEAKNRDDDVATNNGDDDGGGLNTIVRDLMRRRHEEKITRLIAMKKKANEIVAEHRRAANEQAAMSMAAKALSHGFSVLHGLSVSIGKMLVSGKESGDDMRERLLLGEKEIQRESRGAGKERQRVWSECSEEGASAKDLVEKTSAVLSLALARQTTMTFSMNEMKKKRTANDRMFTTLHNLESHYKKQMSSARIISARSTTKQGASSERLAQNLLKNLDRSLSDIEDKRTRAHPASSASSWLDNVAWGSATHMMTTTPITSTNFLESQETVRPALEEGVD